MKYRAEIDGLRTIAVVPVILFHAGFSLFSGGFVGVDIFFVISGFLITTIIAGEMAQDRFSLLTFYERRARRILPALFVVLFVCTPFAWVILMPEEFRDYAQSLVAVVTFISNVQFWRESGYFEAAAELKPLLHTWSLAVEEQFYIFFPLILMALHQFRRRILLVVLGGIFVVSLALAEWGSRAAPTPTFFLLHTRAWELMMGSFAALYLLDRTAPPVSPRLGDLLSALGLAAILYAIFAFSGDTPFPSLYALVPTAGTVLVILFARPGTAVQWLLSRFPFVGIGLVSYSAYLWHQPIFALLRQQHFFDYSYTAVYLATLATFVMAYLSWRFVEAPFRNKRAVPLRRLAVLLSPVWILVLAFGLIVHFNHGTVRGVWLSAQSEDMRRLFTLIETGATEKTWFEDGEDGLSCRFRAKRDADARDVEQRLLACQAQHGPGIAILGDSHSHDLFGAVISRFDAPFIVAVSRHFCDRENFSGDFCHLQSFAAFVKAHPHTFDHVIYERAGFYMMRTPGGVTGTRPVFNQVPLDESLPELTAHPEVIDRIAGILLGLAEQVPVTWFGPRIEPHITSSMIYRHGCDAPFPLRPNQEAVFRRLDRYLAQYLAGNDRLRYLSQSDIIGYNSATDFMTCDTIYWSDGDHLSARGEAHLGTRLPDDFLQPSVEQTKNPG